MHSDEGASDVDACVGADLLHRDGVFELLPAGGGPAAARNLNEQDDARLLDDLLEKAGAENGK